MPVLIAELTAVGSKINEAALAPEKRAYLEGTRDWPQAARVEAQKLVKGLSTQILREYLESLVSLVRDAVNRGPGYYRRFSGD